AIHRLWTTFWPLLVLAVHAMTVLVWVLAVPRLLGVGAGPPLSAGVFVSFLLYTTMFLDPVETIGQMARTVNRATSSAHRVFDVRALDTGHYREQLGMVLQEPYLFHGTVLENVRYGLPDASLAAVIAACKAANAHDFICKLGQGYDTVVGERGHTLSGGERQRVSIARAILHDPRILILDEATSSVD